jgi:hypothetical protein
VQLCGVCEVLLRHAGLEPQSAKIASELIADIHPRIVGVLGQELQSQ